MESCTTDASSRSVVPWVHAEGQRVRRGRPRAPARGARGARAEGYLRRTTKTLGSSGNSGKRGADFQEEVRVVAEAVGHALEDFDLVVHPFEDARVERESAVREDAGSIRFELPREGDQRGDPTPHGPRVPRAPRPGGRGGG